MKPLGAVKEAQCQSKKTINARLAITVSSNDSLTIQEGSTYTNRTTKDLIEVSGHHLGRGGADVVGLEGEGAREGALAATWRSSFILGHDGRCTQSEESKCELHYEFCGGCTR